MIASIKNLSEIWAERPLRVEPDSESDLLYIFTRLLPALASAMPEIEELANQSIQHAEPDARSHSIDERKVLELAKNIRIPAEILNTADNAVETGQTADTAGTPASEPATLTATQKRVAALQRARAAKATKRAAAPPSTPPETDLTAVA